MTRFAGKTAIVTGASSGIGLAVAERLGSEGARLVLVAAPGDEAELRAGGDRLGAEVLAGDVADPATAEGAAQLAGDRLDVLVANAGIAYYEEFLETPVEHLDRTLAVNVRGTFLFAQAATRAMARGGGGAIVCTASTASFAGEEYQATYNASKGAVAALVRSLAVDLAPLGIRVNAVAPGWTASRPTRAVIDDPVQWSKHRSRIPLDRAAEPAEIAAVHAFLASDDASYVTGAVYVVDGGLTAGYRYANWQAVEPPPEGLRIGIAEDIPADLHGAP